MLNILMWSYISSVSLSYKNSLIYHSPSLKVLFEKQGSAAASLVAIKDIDTAEKCFNKRLQTDWVRVFLNN